jgi:hypothetical protein
MKPDKPGVGKSGILSSLRKVTESRGGKINISGHLPRIKKD